MRQTVEVRRLLPDGRAEVFLERKSVCSGDCGSCGGCGAIRETLFVAAENPIGAMPGERVILESDTRTVMSAIFAVYLLPILLFFAGYAVGECLHMLPGLTGGIGAALGLIPIFSCNRRMEQKKNVFRIVERVLQ